MHIQVKAGTEYSYFDTNSIYLFYEAINQEIQKLLLVEKNPENSIIGAFALHNITLKGGEVYNVWIEYNAKLLPFGLIDAGVHNVIIYDEIPDILLDKYIAIPTMEFKRLSS